MVMKIGHTKVKLCTWIRAVVAHTGETFVQPGFVVLEILKDTWNGALCVLWSQWLKADVFESDVGALKRNFHVGDVILKVQSLWGQNKCTNLFEIISNFVSPSSERIAPTKAG